MTKDEIIEEAGRRLGDESAVFLADCGKAFDWVMLDLASAGAIEDQRQIVSGVRFAAATADYDTRNFVAGSVVTDPSQPYPMVKELRVREWGEEAIIRRAESRIWFERYRASNNQLEGRPRIWQLWPNRRNLQVWPPPDAVAATAEVEILYDVAPSRLNGSDEVQIIPHEDHETLVFGVMARTAQFKDETGSNDLAFAMRFYAEGKSRLKGKVEAPRIGTMARGNL